MRKIFAIILGIIILVFLIPIIFTNRRILNTSTSIKEQEKQKEEKQIEIVDYDYSKYKIIKLLYKDEEKVEEINLDEYIACVISAEMPVTYDIEALKAQAVVARTYTIYKITDLFIFTKMVLAIGLEPTTY